MENYDLKKIVWTEQEFELMEWHDSFIHAITLGSNYEFVLDIDYIFKWIKNGDNSFDFWVSPCTLVFENVYQLIFDIEVTEPFEIVINQIIRENPQKPRNAEFIESNLEYDWTIDTHQGEISFKSIGFKQFVRKTPLLLSSQTLDLKQRDGVAFERTYNFLPV